MHKHIPKRLIDAVQLLTTHPATQREAARMLASPRLTMAELERQLPRLVDVATRDQRVQWTEDERRQLLRAVQSLYRMTRDDVIRVRVNATEHARIEVRARAANRTVSDYVRLRALGEDI